MARHRGSSRSGSENPVSFRTEDRLSLYGDLPTLSRFRGAFLDLLSGARPAGIHPPGGVRFGTEYLSHSCVACFLKGDESQLRKYLNIFRVDF